MHLLYTGEDGDFSLAEFFGKQIPFYAILSHTWIANHEEVTYKDIMKGRGKDKAGYGKLDFIAKQSASDELKYFWVDTCCIDKASSAELQEAINSMFLWYQKASKCYVYLADVSSGANGSNDTTPVLWEDAFLRSRWFTRGWTLQELLAPQNVEFYSNEGNFLGDKATLWPHIEKVTKILLDILQGSYAHLLQHDVDVRLSWAIERETTREEDAAYSLLGLFDLHIPLLYGEGRNKAFMRLHRERESLMEYQKLQNLATQKVKLKPSGGDVRPTKNAVENLQRQAPLKRTASEAFAGSPTTAVQEIDVASPRPHVANIEIIEAQTPRDEVIQSPQSEGNASQDAQPARFEAGSHEPSVTSLESVPELITSQEPDMKASWDDATAKNMNMPDYYTHVSVLLIKWVDELDELQTRQELEELEGLFRWQFNFSTKVVELDVASKPQHQLSSHVSSFIVENDGPNNLLIVYYTGHGVYYEDQNYLDLTASTNPLISQGFVQYARANWNKMEEGLLEEVNADVLTVLDTVYASNITKDRPVLSNSASGVQGSNRSRRFQTLAACSIDQTTAAPGRFSFTRALIDTLQEHLNIGGDRTISTFLLNQRICLRKLRTDTPSHLWTRLASDEHILLRPLKSNHHSKLRRPSPQVGSRLTLEFELHDETLNTAQIRYLSESLTKALKDKSIIGLSGLNWVDLVPAPWTHFASIALAMRAVVRWRRFVTKQREWRESSGLIGMNYMGNRGPSSDMPDAVPS